MTVQFSADSPGHVASGLRRSVASGVAPADAPVPLLRRRAVGSVARLVQRWRDREQLRWELSMMRPGDFGDLAVPYSMVVSETRRWPWQKVSPQWGEIRSPAGMLVKPGEF